MADKTFYVNKTGSNTAPYDTPETAADELETIRGYLTQTDNNTIKVDAGTYATLTANLKVDSTSAAVTMIIEGIADDPEDVVLPYIKIEDINGNNGATTEVKDVSVAGLDLGTSALGYNVCKVERVTCRAVALAAGAIYVHDAYNNSYIKDCTVKGNSAGIGIRAEGTPPSFEISGNTVGHCDSNEGMKVIIANSAITIQDNIIQGCNEGMEIERNSSYTYDIDYNCLYDNGTDFVAAGAVPVTGQGDNTINTDPLLWDYDNARFYLSEGSPCIGTGYASDNMGSKGIWRPGKILAYRIDTGTWREIASGIEPTIFALDENADVMVYTDQDLKIYSTAADESVIAKVELKTFEVSHIRNMVVRYAYVTYKSASALSLKIYSQNDNTLLKTCTLAASADEWSTEKFYIGYPVQKFSVVIEEDAASAGVVELGTITFEHD